ncbi:hypothetical protein QUF58_13775 [Anaerolineales bacterium HSG24]|nr:hypothetical protein [Anaerolineales bacterium HSG24]
MKRRTATIFFGRTSETRQLASLVIAQRAVLFHAQSGAGKTSLLQAGLIPRLKGRKKIISLPITRVSGELPSNIAPSAVNNLFVFNTLLNMVGQEADPQSLVGLTAINLRRNAAINLRRNSIEYQGLQGF